MKNPNKVFNLTIEVLSPLHIGTGEKLNKQDFYHAAKELWVINPILLIQQIKAKGISKNFVDACEKGLSLDDYLGKNKIDRESVRAYRLKEKCTEEKDIYTFIKTPDFRPYIPGSSLKGSVRSALFRAAMSSITDSLPKDVNEEIKRRMGEKSIGRKIEAFYFGADEHHDWLRTLNFVDSEPLELNEASNMQLIEIKVLSTRPDRQTNSEILVPKKFSIYVEAIPAGQSFQARSIIQENLFFKTASDAGLNFQQLEKTVKNFCAICNSASEHLIKQEISFFKKKGETTLENIYKRLEAELVTTKKANNQCLLQISYGSGSKPKTAFEFLDKTIKDEIRYEYQLGRILHKTCKRTVKHDSREKGKWYCKNCNQGKIPKSDVILLSFPKSRKVALIDGKYQPLGWIRLTAQPIS